MLVVAVACGGSASAQDCRKPGERFPHQAITVQQALKHQGELVTVSGAVFARDGKPQKLCAGLRRGSPPTCRHPSLSLAGIRDLAAFDQVESRGHAEWVESATWPVRVEGHTLTFELSCASEQVVKAFHDRTGETLTLNAFGSTVEVERLDFATVPAHEPARLRRKFGYFAVRVRVGHRGPDPLAAALRGRKPDAHGIFWLRDGGEWYAVKRYQPNLLAGWLAGNVRRVDARWRRLDQVLTAVSKS